MAESAAVDAAAAALHEAGCSIPECHRAMHATANTQAEEEIARVVIEAAGPHIAAAERERLAQEAEKVGATFRSTYSFTERCSKILKFADLIREGLPDLEQAEREPG